MITFKRDYGKLYYTQYILLTNVGQLPKYIWIISFTHYMQMTIHFLKSAFYCQVHMDHK